MLAPFNTNQASGVKKPRSFCRRYHENIVPRAVRPSASPRLPQDSSHISIAGDAASTGSGRETDSCGNATCARVHARRVRQ